MPVGDLRSPSRWFAGHFHNNVVTRDRDMQLVITAAAGAQIIMPDDYDYANVRSCRDSRAP